MEGENPVASPILILPLVIVSIIILWTIPSWPITNKEQIKKTRTIRTIGSIIVITLYILIWLGYEKLSNSYPSIDK